MTGYRLLLVILLLVLPWPVPAQEAAPCSTPEHAQFDFWLGEWRVTGAQGGHAGDNSITKALGGCVLREDWTGVRGLRGQSFNIYSSASGRWHQTWVDSSGMLLVLSGGLVDGSMVLEGVMPHPRHGEVTHRISWTPQEDGTVRQFWQFSTDGGASWAALFDGLYTRK